MTRGTWFRNWYIIQYLPRKIKAKNESWLELKYTYTMLILKPQCVSFIMMKVKGLNKWYFVVMWNINTCWFNLLGIYKTLFIYNESNPSPKRKENPLNFPSPMSSVIEIHLIIFSLLWVTTQLQNCRLSLRPPVHSSDSDQRVHTWKKNQTS